MSDPFAGIDLDECLDPEGSVKPWGQGIVERFSDCYTEISPSGSGLKIWAHGALRSNLPGVKVADGQIELYDHARYFAVTGRAFRGAPLAIEDHVAGLLLLYEPLTQGKARRWPMQPLEGGRIPYGQQHSTLVSIAGTLRARRVCDERRSRPVCRSSTSANVRGPDRGRTLAGIVRSSRQWGRRA